MEGENIFFCVDLGDWRYTFVTFNCLLVDLRGLQSISMLYMLSVIMEA